MTESREELPYAIQRKFVSIFPKGPNCQGELRIEINRNPFFTSVFAKKKKKIGTHRHIKPMT